MFDILLHIYVVVSIIIMGLEWGMLIALLYAIGLWAGPTGRVPDNGVLCRTTGRASDLRSCAR